MAPTAEQYLMSHTMILLDTHSLHGRGERLLLCRWLASTFNYIVREHWQLDTFGHSGVNGALSAMSGMTARFWSRLDTEMCHPRTALCASRLTRCDCEGPVRNGGPACTMFISGIENEKNKKAD